MRVFAHVLSALVLASCASAPQRIEGPPPPSAPSGVNCPSNPPESAFASLPTPCKGRFALERSAAAHRAGRWKDALAWAELARKHLEPSLAGFAGLREAEARYALGETTSVEPLLRAALPFADTPSASAELHYSIGEIAVRNRQPVNALHALAAAINADPKGPWRPAAEALITAVATEAGDEIRDPDKLPAALQPLAKLLLAEQLVRQGKGVEAAPLLKEASESAELKSLGLDERAKARLAEISENSAAKPGMVGVVLPLSGRTATFGVYTLRGLLLSIDPYKDRDVTLLVEDDRGEPFRSSRAMRSIARQGGLAVVGPLIGKSAEAGVIAAQSLGMPTVVLSSSELPALAPWVVRMAVTPRQQIEALLEETMDRRGFKRFAILLPAEPYGMGMRDLFWDAVLARGGQITGVQSYEPGSTDFKWAIRRLAGADDFTPEEIKARKAANQPLAHLDFDGVFLPDGAKTVGLILPQLLYHDIRGPLFFGPSTWNDPRLLDLARDYAEGSLFLDWYWPAAPGEETRQFVAAYESAYGEARPPSITAQGYEAGRLLAPTLKSATRGEVREAMASRSWNSFSGKAKVGSDGEVQRPLTYLTVTGKQIVPADESGQ